MQNLPVQYQNKSINQYQNADYLILPEPEDTSELSIFDYIKIVKKRKLLFLSPTILILPLIIFYVISQRPIYEAKATLLIKQKAENILSVKGITPDDTVSGDYLNTQYEIIKSRPIAEIVVKTLKLNEKPKQEATSFEKKVKQTKELINLSVNSILSIFIEKNQEDINLELDHSLSTLDENMNNVITSLQESIEVSPRPKTQLVDIFIHLPNAVDAAEQINTVAKVYLEQNLDDKLSNSNSAITWLEAREENLRGKINQTESSIQDLRKKDRILNHEKINNSSIFSVQKLENLQSMYLDANTKKENLKISIEELNSALQRGVNNITFSSFNSVNSPTLSTFIAERNRANQEYLGLKNLFGSRHPKLIKSKSNLDQVSALVRSEIVKMLNGLKREYKLLSDRESIIEKEIEGQKLNIINNDDKVIKVNTINKNLDIEKDLYNKVVTRLSEATLIKGLETNNIKIIELARVPASAISSGRFKKIILGLIATLGFGAALAIFADKLDNRFKSIDEVEGYLKLHFIGLIPTHKTKSNQPVTLYDPYAKTSEAFRFIRTWLSNSAPGNPKKILLTSALPGEGKSHTATNLSISFAQLGYSVILIDCDLRRPKLHQNLNLTSNKGLVDILAYNASWQTVVQETDLENLRVITAGGVPHNPAELLSTDRMKYLLIDLEKAFDIVIVDAPITLTIPDVSILTPFIDGILLIHDPDKGAKELTLEMKKMLDRANAPILGIIFNNVSIKKQKQYASYHSYYSNQYSNQKNRTRKQDNKLIDMRPTENEDAWVSAGSSDKNSHINIS